MNILMLGATGRVGGQVVSQALDNGYHITALVRTPDKIQTSHQNLKIVEGNVLNKDDIENSMVGIDVVISALSTGGTTTLSKSIPLIIKAMSLANTKRIITVGTAGILQSRVSPKLLRYQSSESRHKSTRATEEHHKVYDKLNQTDLQWTIVCPTYLCDGDYTGNYRTERDFLPESGLKISIPDVAEFTYNQILSTEYLKARVGIAY